MNVRYPKNEYGLFSEAAVATINAISGAAGAGSQVVGAGVGAASYVTGKRQSEQSMRQQKMLALKAMRSAEASGNRDRIVSARRNLLQLQSTPAYEFAGRRYKTGMTSFTATERLRPTPATCSISPEPPKGRLAPLFRLGWDTFRRLLSPHWVRYASTKGGIAPKRIRA